MHICVYQTLMFPINEMKRQVITKSHFYSQDKWYNHQKRSKISQYFVLDCLSHTNRLKFLKQNCWNLNICTVCARKLQTKHC